MPGLCTPCFLEKESFKNAPPPNDVDTCQPLYGNAATAFILAQNPGDTQVYLG